jgi:hypothetical protein
MHRGLPGIITTLVFVRWRPLDDHPFVLAFVQAGSSISINMRSSPHVTTFWGRLGSSSASRDYLLYLIEMHDAHECI